MWRAILIADVVRAAVASLLALLIVVSPVAAQSTVQPGAKSRDLTSLNLEELANVEVITVSKTPEKLTKVPAAVTVITREEIRRSGATSIPEALRWAPGIHVARIDSSNWATGIRGFSSRLSRSMLVLIDGRSVYTPLFAGVYWQVQDTLLEDIDRIEVIRGPGGTLWGANAVNGIVNIVTQSAKETQGGLVTTGGGSYEHGFAGFRYGGKAGTDAHYRVYGKFFNRDAFFHRVGTDFDDWRMGQMGFRSDGLRGPNNTWTVQGDFYVGRAGQRTVFSTLSPPALQRVEDDIELSGGNLLARWKRNLKNQSQFALQLYYDRTNREEPQFQEHRDTFDIDFQYRLATWRRQRIISGAGYRVSSGKATGVPTITFTPERRTENLYTAFAHDEISFLNDRLRLTVGSKFEHNDYSGGEFQPTARLSWTPTPQQAIWAAFTRAVRTPSRVEHDLSAYTLLNPAVPAFTRILTDGSFESEKTLAYEVGYRTQPVPQFFVSLDVFYTSYQDLLSIEPGAPVVETTPPPTRTVFPVFIRNGLGGRGLGGQLTYEWVPRAWWRLGGTYSYLQLDLKPEAGSRDASTGRSTEGASPRHRVSFRSFFNLPRSLELDFSFRFVDRLPSQRVDAYSTLDARLAWRRLERLEISLVGRDLLQDHHAEFGGGSAGLSEVKRSVYGKVTWRW